jgi:hypothetical protein
MIAGKHSEERVSLPEPFCAHRGLRAAKGSMTCRKNDFFGTLWISRLLRGRAAMQGRHAVSSS